LLTKKVTNAVNANTDSVNIILAGLKRKRRPKQKGSVQLHCWLC